MEPTHGHPWSTRSTPSPSISQRAKQTLLHASSNASRAPPNATLTDSHVRPTRALTRHSQSRYLRFGPSGSRARSRCQCEDPADSPHGRAQARASTPVRRPLPRPTRSGQGTPRAFHQNRPRRMSSRAADRKPPPPRARAARLRRPYDTRGRIARPSSSPRTLGQPPPTVAESGATTASAASSTSTTEPPPGPKRIWRPSPAQGVGMPSAFLGDAALVA
jgi:hypothetical protein